MHNDTVNEIILTGRLVAEKNRSDGSCVITMFSKCSKDVFLRFYCAPGVMPEHKKHAMLKIKGHLRIRKIVSEEEERANYTQGFVADEITPMTTLVEDRYGVKGKFFAEPECYIYIKGVVHKVTPVNNYYRIHVRTNEGPGSKRDINVMLNMKKLDRQPAIHPGDTIYTVCSASTPIEEKGEDKIYWEDIIISDLAI